MSVENIIRLPKDGLGDEPSAGGLKAKNSFDLVGAAPLVVCVVLTVVFYFETILWWTDEWTRPGSFYAHGVFIPFFVGLMIWRDRERLKRMPISRNWWGLALAILSVFIVILSHKADVTVTRSIAFILFLIGTTLLLVGKPITRALLFPLIFLATMIPIVPDQLINPVAFPVQVASAKMAATVCNLIGFPAVRTGTYIQMDSYLLNVELPCSGFKTLVGLMAFSAAFSYLVEGATWKRWLMFFCSGPLAVLVNGIRITLIALVGEVMGAGAAHSFHDWSGFIVLILGFTFLFNFARILKCERFLGMDLSPAPSANAEPGVRLETSAETRAANEQAALDKRYGKTRKGTLRFMAAGIYPIILMLVIACGVKASIHPNRVRVKPIGPAEVPTMLSGKWEKTGPDVPITEEVKSQTNPDAWLDRFYVGPPPAMARINLLISAGSGRKVFHDPHTCFLGNGFFLRDLRVETVQTPAGPVTAQLAEVEDAKHNKSLMMFLYVVDGQQIQTTQGVNIALMWQTIFGDSGRPSYFLRFRHMLDGTGPDRLEELHGFVREVWGAIGPKVK